MRVPHIYLQNEKLLVAVVFGHGGIFFVIIGDVVSLDVHGHLKLLQIQQHLELLRVVLPAQGALQHGSLRHSTWKVYDTIHCMCHSAEAGLI